MGAAATAAPVGARDGMGSGYGGGAWRSRRAVLLLTVAACLLALALLSQGSDAMMASARASGPRWG